MCRVNLSASIYWRVHCCNGIHPARSDRDEFVGDTENGQVCITFVALSTVKKKRELI